MNKLLLALILIFSSVGYAAPKFTHLQKVKIKATSKNDNIIFYKLQGRKIQINNYGIDSVRCVDGYVYEPVITYDIPDIFICESDLESL